MEKCSQIVNKENNFQITYVFVTFSRIKHEDTEA